MTVFVNEALNNDVQYPDSFKNNANDSLWVSHCIITQLIISRHRSIQKFESSTESLNHSHQICSKHWFTVINEWPSLWLSYWIIISWFAQEWSKWLWVTEAFTHPLKKTKKYPWFFLELTSDHLWVSQWIVLKKCVQNSNILRNGTK